MFSDLRTPSQLAQCNAESLPECWRMWSTDREHTHIGLSDLQAALPTVRRAIQFDQTRELRVELVKNRTRIYWPGTGYVPDSAW